MNKKLRIVLLGSMFLSLTANAQQDSIKVDSVKADTVAVKKEKSLEEKEFDEYNKLIKKEGQKKEGLLTIHKIEDKWYFEIPDSLYGRYLLTVTRLTQAPQNFSKYGGEMVNQQTVYFERINKKVFLRALIHTTESDPNDQITMAVENASVNPIVTAFKVVARNPATKSELIDVTDFLIKDNSITSLAAKEKTDNKISSVQEDRSYIESVNTYPINIEARVVKTYTSTAGTPAAMQTGQVTLGVNTSFVLLPKEPMRKRLLDTRIGYFASKVVRFADNLHQTESNSHIQRYRLEPRPEDMAKYQRGELVHPKKQIVFYIDPATPKKWVPYLIQGVNDWNKAFEEAGFKDAIVGKEWPNDSTMSLEDARYSVIRYYASEKANAYGPRIADPRSGEIIEAHVGWYHNITKLLRNWYMIQVGPLDKRAQKMTLDDELMGELIRFVSSHEVGHSIGLRHNMMASAMTPVEKLRDKNWLKKNGHTLSIMDYARFNYVAQPEDNVGSEGIFPRIGSYDKWAIQWGYKYLPKYKDEYEEQKALSKEITEKLKVEPRFWFVADEGKGEDPRSQNEDLGDDAVKASDYGIMNLQRVAAGLVKWTEHPDGRIEDLKDMHKQLCNQYSRYLYHVMKYLGRRYVSIMPGEPVYKEVPRERVKSVIDYLDRQLFEAPLWMYPQDIYERIGFDTEKEVLELQAQMLNMVVSSGLIYNVHNLSFRSSNPYCIDEYLDDLKKAVWKPIHSGEERRNHYRRILQRRYLAKVEEIVNPLDRKEGKILSAAQQSDIKLYVLRHLRHIESHIKEQLASEPANSLNTLHYEELLIHITKMLKERKGE